jgi:deoxyribodipyrimidine photo-lyase
VQALFIFDRDILDKLDDKHDRRLVFIHLQLKELNRKLREQGATLLVKHGRPCDVWKALTGEYRIDSVYTNHDYEPYALKRDAEIREYLESGNIAFHTFKDQVVFEKDEVVKDDGTPYTVFTPYSKKWKQKVRGDHFRSYPSGELKGKFLKSSFREVPSLKSLGFEEFEIIVPPNIPDLKKIRNYAHTRDIPSLDATTHLSVHLRFGTVSIRDLFRRAWTISEKWTDELIWREFYMSILWHFPLVTERSFKPVYDKLVWKADEENFKRWCDGLTGFPIVDAGMRELSTTGFMHNRLRMITSTFLTKYLLIDWRWGEAWFAKKLIDFDLSANNGGWQWSAGTGVDAAPYFRIFSMESQTKRFDPELKYIKKWIPEFGTKQYPEPVVDYEFARKRCLDFYKHGLS